MLSPIISWLFSGGKEGHTSQNPYVLVGLRRPNIKREISVAFCTKFERHTFTTVTLAKPWTEFMFCPKVHLAKKVAFYFSYSGHKRNCWLKIVNQRDKRDNGGMRTGKEIKSDLKLFRMETDVATNTCDLLLRRKPEHRDINIVLL